MSLPNLPEIPTIDRDGAINLILSSIAMEELGLSHVINAEGEKLQYAIGTIEGVSGPAEPATIQELLELNKSVRDTLDSAMQNQIFLKGKMESALSASVLQGPTGSTGPAGPAGPASGLSAFAGIYNNVNTSIGGTADIPIIVPMPFANSSRNVSFATSNSITVSEAGVYHIIFNLLASFSESATLIYAIRSNGVNIESTKDTLTAGANAPVWYSGDVIVDLPAGAVVDMVVIPNVNLTMSFDEATTVTLKVFKLD